MACKGSGVQSHQFHLARIALAREPPASGNHEQHVLGEGFALAMMLPINAIRPAPITASLQRLLEYAIDQRETRRY
jgi:hypothetical protein